MCYAAGAGAVLVPMPLEQVAAIFGPPDQHPPQPCLLHQFNRSRPIYPLI